MIYFTPGPTQLYPTVSKHLHNAITLEIPSISHRSSTYIEIHRGVWEKLQKLYNIPDDYVMFLAGSATQLMERTIQNTVIEKSFHCVNGSFSRRFYEIARDLGKKPECIKASLGNNFDVNLIKIPQQTELITFTAVETSSGVATNIEEIYNIAARNPEALIAVDTVSALPAYCLDVSRIDITLFSVQKGFGLPAGLGIAIVSPRAIKKAEEMKSKGISLGSFGSWPLIYEKAKNFQTLETPNVLGMYLFNEVLNDMINKGISTIRLEAQEKDEMISTMINNHPIFKFYIKQSQHRAQSVNVIEYENPDAVVNFMKAQGYMLGGGYGEDKHKQFRIANFPAISTQQMQEMLNILNTYKH